MKRRITLYKLLSVMLIGGLSAIARLRPTVEVLDFGIIHEEAGKKTMRAWVVNESDSMSRIRRTKVTCGCTAADYYGELLAPGDSAWVDIVYNPAGRPGRFEKAVKVYGPNDDISYINISGTVIGTPETLASAYPVEAGAIRLTDSIVTIPAIRHGNSRHLFINAYNTSDRPVKIFLSSPDAPERALSLDTAPEIIAPGELGTISFYMNTRFEKRIGPVTYRVYMTASDTDGNEIISSDSPMILEVRTIIEQPSQTEPSQKS